MQSDADKLQSDASMCSTSCPRCASSNEHERPERSSPAPRTLAPLVSQEHLVGRSAGGVFSRRRERPAAKLLQFQLLNILSPECIMLGLISHVLRAWQDQPAKWLAWCTSARLPASKLGALQGGGRAEHVHVVDSSWSYPAGGEKPAKLDVHGGNWAVSPWPSLSNRAVRFIVVVTPTACAQCLGRRPG